MFYRHFEKYPDKTGWFFTNEDGLIAGPFKFYEHCRLACIFNVKVHALDSDCDMQYDEWSKAVFDQAKIK